MKPSLVMGEFLCGQEKTDLKSQPEPRLHVLLCNIAFTSSEAYMPSVCEGEGVTYHEEQK